MRFRITTGLSAEEIRDALSKHIEPKVIFRNYLQNKPKLFEGNISTTNFELRRIETHRSITKVTLQGILLSEKAIILLMFRHCIPGQRLLFIPVSYYTLYIHHIMI